MSIDQSQIQDLAPIKPDIKPGELIVHDEGEYSMLMDTAKFNQAWRVAKMFSESKLVPAHFQGSTASVFVALHMAMRMNLDPMMVMQNTYMLKGRPGMEAKLLIALVNARGPFKGPIQWEFKGEGNTRQCTAFAIHKITGERCEVTVTWDMVKAEGWNQDRQFKDGSGVQKSKWNTLADMMFRYRSATFLARLYCPEVIMGLNTVDELEDVNGEIIEAETVPAPPQVELEKKTQASKIKDELKTRKPRSDKGQTRKETSPEAAGEAISPESEQSPWPEGTRPDENVGNPVKPIAPEHLEKIRTMLKDKPVDESMVCKEWEVDTLESLDYEQGVNCLEWLHKMK